MEELIDEGIVINSQEGIAEVAVVQNDNCQECGAKPFCKTGSVDTNTLRVIDPYGVEVGDEVKISIEGGAVFKAAVMLYGLPLLLLLFGIFGGMLLFTSTKNSELISFLLGFFLMAVYYIGLYFKGKVGKIRYLSKIVFVKKRN